MPGIDLSLDKMQFVTDEIWMLHDVCAVHGHFMLCVQNIGLA
jgi:hypothetical protein